MRNRILRGFIPVLVLVFLYAPILILALYSFTDATQIGAIRSFTLKNYVTLFTTEELRDMIIGTIVLALVSSVIATILGTLGAIGAFYSRKRTAGAISTINQVPVINADVVTGFSLCILLVVVFGISKSTYIPLVIGHVVLSAPFVYLSVTPKLKQMDRSLPEAAMDLGCTPMRAFFKATLPEIMPGIITGMLMAFTLSLDDFVISYFTTGNSFQTLPIRIYNMTKKTVTPKMYALATIIFFVILALLLISNLTDQGEKQASE